MGSTDWRTDVEEMGRAGGLTPDVVLFVCDEAQEHAKRFRKHRTCSRCGNGPTVQGVCRDCGTRQSDAELTLARFEIEARLRARRLAQADREGGTW